MLTPLFVLPVQRECAPEHFFLCAANAAIEQRKAARFARDARGGVPALKLDVVPGRFVGQLVVRQPPRRLTEEEFVQHLEVRNVTLFCFESPFVSLGIFFEALALRPWH